MVTSGATAFLSRRPRGRRGLKRDEVENAFGPMQSPPARAAWIKTTFRQRGKLATALRLATKFGPLRQFNLAHPRAAWIETSCSRCTNCCTGSPRPRGRRGLKRQLTCSSALRVSPPSPRLQVSIQDSSIDLCGRSGLEPAWYSQSIIRILSKSANIRKIEN